MIDWSTLADLVDRAGDRFPDRRLHFPGDRDSISFAALAARSDRVAGGLAAAGVEAGEIVALLYPTCADFAAAFFGVAKAGGVPTVLPQPFSRSAAHVARIAHIVADGRVRFLARHETFADYVQESVPGIRTLATRDLEDAGAPPPTLRRRPEDLAFVQYTSGSTSNPKGVALAHANIRAGMEAIIDAIEVDEHDVNGQWIPLHHDMGLIGLLTGIAAGMEQHLWSPAEFVRRPREWIESFAACRATVFAGPSFAYAYLLQAVDEETAATIDLSAWRVAFNGAEQVNPVILELFLDRFARSGLRRETMLPVYGLAEATLAVTIPRRGSTPRVDWIDRVALANERRAVAVAPDHPLARGVTCVGPPVRHVALRIADESAEPLPDRTIGEIHVRGGPVMEGYLGRSRDADTFTPDGWFRTGDLGYCDNGFLFVTGRRREMIVVRGENYYPGDVEAVVQPLSGIHFGRCVAFAYERDDGERLALLAETALDEPGERAELQQRIRASVGRELGLADVDVRLLKVNSIRRTTNGKTQRLAMRDLLVRGEVPGEWA